MKAPDRFRCCVFVGSAAILLCISRPANAQFGGGVQVNLGIGAAPNAITGTAAGDLDGDGNGDVIGTENRVGGNIGVARGLGAGAYSAPILSGPTPATTAGMTLPNLGDFDLDGVLDLVTAGDVGGVPNAFVWRGNPAVPGAFLAPTAFAILPVGHTISGIRVTDLDGNGNQDVACAIIGPNRRIVVIPGAGGMTFGPLVTTSTAIGSNDIDVCVSFNGDAFKDVVVCGPMAVGGSPGMVQVFRGSSVGLVNPINILLPAGVEPIDVNWIDCNQDKRYDLAVACQGTQPGIYLIPNLGPPNFFPATIAAGPKVVTNIPNSVLRLETDFDGIEDLSLLSAASGASTVQTDFEILKVKDCGANTAVVTNVGTYDVPSVAKVEAQLHAVQDQDFDGKEDLVLVNQTGTSDRAVVFFNQSANANYTISPVRPLLGQTVLFTLQFKAPAPTAGKPFMLLFTLNGTSPGIMGGNQKIPLNPPFLPLFIGGTVPIGGQVTLTSGPVAIPAAPATFSAQVASAAIVEGNVPGSIGFVTNPAVVTLP